MLYYYLDLLIYFSHTGCTISLNAYTSFVEDCEISEEDSLCNTSSLDTLFIGDRLINIFRRFFAPLFFFSFCMFWYNFSEAVNVEHDKKSEESKVNEEKLLVRFEFIDIITRIASLKYGDDVVAEHGYSQNSCAQAVELLFRRNLLPHASPIVLHDPNIYRVVSAIQY